MRIAVDVESHLIKPGLLAPRLVCVSWATEHGEHGLMARDEGLDFVAGLLAAADVEIVGHNVAYDLGVICAERPELIGATFAAYVAGRIRDTMIRQKLIDLADGVLTENRNKKAYSLAALSTRWLGKALDKGELGWRLRYAELDGVPLEDWPERARKYAEDDAISTMHVFAYQEKDAGEIRDEAAQTRAAWALHLLSMWGCRTDATAVEILRQSLETEREKGLAIGRAAGLVRADGTRDMEAIRTRLEASGSSARTPKGKISTAGEHLRESLDPVLMALEEAAGAIKLLGTYVPKLKEAATRPLTPRYDSLLETGRTSASDNAQTPPRRGGVRECFVPRDGFLLLSVDYDGAELRAWGQACLDLLGHSRMAKLFQDNPDADPHAEMGAMLLGISPEVMRQKLSGKDQLAKDARQLAKVANFGFPGGMGVDSFVEYARGYGLVVPYETAERAREAWREAWPESREYFEYVSSICGDDAAEKIVQLRSKRIRGRVSYCATANTFFQGLVADGAKKALFDVARECYADPTSPLYGSRPIMFLHDEIVAEVPERRAAEAASRMVDVMVAAMREFLPDVPVTASPALMRRWYKEAEEVRGPDGRLIAWEPKEKEERVA